MKFYIAKSTRRVLARIARMSSCMLFVGAVVLASCAPSCKNNGGLVTPSPPVITDQGSCRAACDNLSTLNCRESMPIDMGTECNAASDCKDIDGNSDPTQFCFSTKCMTSCTNFCIVTENRGVWLDPVCVSHITKCSDIETCPAAVKNVPTDTCTGPACPTQRGK